MNDDVIFYSLLSAITYYLYYNGTILQDNKEIAIGISSFLLFLPFDIFVWKISYFIIKQKEFNVKYFFSERTVIVKNGKTT